MQYKNLVPDHFELQWDQKQIEAGISHLARTIITPWAQKITRETGEQPLALCVLRGGVPFFSELIQQIECSVEPAFCRTWSYRSDSNAVKRCEIEWTPVGTQFHGRTVLLVDDICDTGGTLNFLEKKLLEEGAKEIKVAVLIHRKVPNSSFHPDWSIFAYEGIEWFVGFGMEDKNRYSNFPAVFKIQPSS
ncbi:MAG: hypothetical protein B7X06_02295 [Verrucomicrobia bacterium 21-51-4]|nr:MAG: hypothetical protein B7X06_02295 [Verrucomicrobia bacterium 21-51-4]HQU08877.1 phosphoribosyltransferase family protein [Opitutales bacterium]